MQYHQSRLSRDSIIPTVPCDKSIFYLNYLPYPLGQILFFSPLLMEGSEYVDAYGALHTTTPRWNPLHTPIICFLTSVAWLDSRNSLPVLQRRGGRARRPFATLGSTSLGRRIALVSSSPHVEFGWKELDADLGRVTLHRVATVCDVSLFTPTLLGKCACKSGWKPTQTERTGGKRLTGLSLNLFYSYCPFSPSHSLFSIHVPSMPDTLLEQ